MPSKPHQKEKRKSCYAIQVLTKENKMLKALDTVKENALGSMVLHMKACGIREKGTDKAYFFVLTDTRTKVSMWMITRMVQERKKTNKGIYPLPLGKWE